MTRLSGLRKAFVMNREEIHRFLEESHIKYEWFDHRAVYNMQEMTEIGLPHPEAEAKNLFVRDDKKRNYYLITVKGDKRVDLKQFQLQNGTRRLSFASDTDLEAILGLTPGAVTPFGLLNDAEKKVIFYLDKAFFEEPGLIAVHPNDNTASVCLKTEDLIRIIQEQGTQVSVIEIM